MTAKQCLNCDGGGFVWEPTPGESSAASVVQKPCPFCSGLGLTFPGRKAAAPEPLPTKGLIDVLPEVIADLKARDKHGTEKYGTTLQTHNGRDPLLDAYQEALDLAMYLKQALLEKSG